MIDDESLERLLFQARADSPLRGSRLSDEQEILLNKITGDPSVDRVVTGNIGNARRNTRKGIEWRFLGAWPVAAILVLMVSLVGVTMPLWAGITDSASAVTPRILPTQPVGKEAGELLMEISRGIVASGQIEPLDIVRFQFWALDFSVTEHPLSMQPQETVIQYLHDGRKTLETRALQSRDADGNPVNLPEDYDVEEIIFHHIFGVDEPVGLFPKPTAETDWGTLLREGEGLALNASAADYFRAVSNLRSEYPLSQTEQSGLLNFLSTLPGIRVEGSTVDRLGREGLMFSASEDDYLRVLIVSTESGLLAYESIYMGSERTDVSPPAVIDYRAWY